MYLKHVGNRRDAMPIIEYPAFLDAGESFYLSKITAAIATGEQLSFGITVATGKKIYVHSISGTFFDSGTGWLELVTLSQTFATSTTLTTLTGTIVKGTSSLIYQNRRQGGAKASSVVKHSATTAGTETAWFQQGIRNGYGGTSGTILPASSRLSEGFLFTAGQIILCRLICVTTSKIPSLSLGFIEVDA